MENKNWYVCDKNGNLAGHDMDEMKAKQTAAIMNNAEPEKEWEALEKKE